MTEQVERVLEVIDDKEYSTKELMELLGLMHRPTFRDDYLLPALALRYFEMTIPDKPNSSKKKYRKVKKIKTIIKGEYKWQTISSYRVLHTKN